jgi:hypothetical protein
LTNNDIRGKILFVADEADSMEAFIYRAWIVGGVLFKDEKRQIKL